MDKWMEIDLKKLKNNIRTLQRHIRVPIMAVLKNDAYGLGAISTGRFMEQCGIAFFAVTSSREAVELRKGGIRSPILVFAPVIDSEEDLDYLWQYEITPSVYSLETAETLNNYAVKKDRPIDVHVKVDTGMGRMGFSPDEVISSAGRLLCLKGLNYRGVFTHYSNAFEKEMAYSKKQLDSFLRVVDTLAGKGLTFGVKYSANSLAALKFPCTHMDMVSIGSAFLGNSTVNPQIPLQQVYRYRARVLQVRELKKGSFVGYSKTYRVRTDIRAAVIPVGYADGFGVQKKIDSFRLSDYLREQYHLIKSFIRPADTVLYNGSPLKVIGKIGMQLTVVDIGDPPVRAGDILDIKINPLLAGSGIERVYTHPLVNRRLNLGRLKQAEPDREESKAG